MGASVFDETHYDHGRRTVFCTLLKSVLEYVEYKAVPLNEVTVEVQSKKIPRGKGRLTITKDNAGRKNKGEFRFGPIRAYVYLLAVSQSKCPDLLYFRLRYDFYTRIPLYK